MNVCLESVVFLQCLIHFNHVVLCLLGPMMRAGLRRRDTHEHDAQRQVLVEAPSGPGQGGLRDIEVKINCFGVVCGTWCGVYMLCTGMCESVWDLQERVFGVQLFLAQFNYFS